MSSSLRILYIVDSLKVGGAELLVLGMLRRYAAQGHEVSLAYFSEGPLRQELIDAGVRFTRLSRRGLGDPIALFRLLSLIGREQPDVVHTHLRKSDMLGQLGASLKRVKARISTAHNVDPWRRSGLLTLVHHGCVRGCQRVIAVSKLVEDYLKETRTFPPEKILTIDNGIDLERFDPERVEPLDRAEWGLEAGTTAIGVIGRLAPQKGHDQLLEAAVPLVERHPEARFVFVGDGPLRPDLERRRSELELENHVVFAGLSREIPRALAALDVVVFSSLWEGLPLTLLEAMAMRRPVVATSVGGIPDVIEDGETGLLVPPAQPEALLAGLDRLLSSPGLGAAMGSKAADVVRRSYSIDAMYEKTLAVYRSCLAHP